MAGKSKREKIKLVSSAGTGFYYTTNRGREIAGGGKLELKKYDPVAKKHVAFKEAKIK
jgi:large subunit ribosomal protein L33